MYETCRFGALIVIKLRQIKTPLRQDFAAKRRLESLRMSGEITTHKRGLTLCCGKLAVFIRKVLR